VPTGCRCCSVPLVKVAWSRWPEPLWHPGPASPGGTSRMPAVNDVGEPCAGEPHALDGRELETGLRTRAMVGRKNAVRGNRYGTAADDLQPGDTTAPAPDPAETAVVHASTQIAICVTTCLTGCRRLTFSATFRRIVVAP